MTFSYAAASLGVKLRHGPHQCALKYTPMCLPASVSSLSVFFSPSPVKNSPDSPPSASSSVGGIQGKFSTVSGDNTAPRPSLVITSPFSSRITRVGMPDTLYLELRAFFAARFA